MRNTIKVTPLAVVVAVVLFATVFFIGVVLGSFACPECEPKIVTQEVEKIVYKDTPETLEYVRALEEGLDSMSDAYLTVFDVAKIEMDDNNMEIGQGYYEIYNFAKAWLEK